MALMGHITWGVASGPARCTRARGFAHAHARTHARARARAVREGPRYNAERYR